MLKLKPSESAPNSLKMPHLKAKDLDKKNEMDKVIQQQIIIEPEIVRFAGFEVGKLNLLKIRVINKYLQPQRILVIPPKTNFFNVKYDKKGAIASGMFEEIYISFKPFEYKQYQDSMRINTQFDSILIPIHAFPAINRDYLRDLFPRYLDFGTLELGEQFSQRFPIQNKVPLNFDFEFIVIKDNMDFRITPLRGTIPDKGVTEIEILYRPSINVTVYMEVELIVGSVDFEPLPIKLMGTGRSQNDKNLSRIRRPQSVRKLHSIIQQPKQNQKLIPKELQSSQENIDEYSIPEQSPQVIYEATGGNDQVEQFYPIIKPTTKRIRPQIIENEVLEIKQGVSLQGRQVKEKQYLDHFNQIANLDKEKENKLKQCIGDSPIQKETISEIISQREQFNQQMLNQIYQSGITRYQLQLNIDNAVADQILPKYECQWDFEKNDVIKIKKIVRRLFSISFETKKIHLCSNQSYLQNKI
ncbi:unnamed protein product [Paramecium octaurelia]|uniref:CFAP65 fourth Ig-like domain-containing protein n=1 Tax=Paramecium octaurelia TaxID=43137 RepID=A0A8S1U009_PAROT|nr:unnamed protein product [Paramecium octaurelia]